MPLCGAHWALRSQSVHKLKKNISLNDVNVVSILRKNSVPSSNFNTLKGYIAHLLNATCSNGKSLYSIKRAYDSGS